MLQLIWISEAPLYYEICTDFIALVCTTYDPLENIGSTQLEWHFTKLQCDYLWPDNGAKFIS